MEEDLNPPQILQLCGYNGILYDESEHNFNVTDDPLALRDGGVYRIIAKPSVFYRKEKKSRQETPSKKVSFLN